MNLNLRLVGEEWPLKYSERFRISLGSGQGKQDMVDGYEVKGEQLERTFSVMQREH